MGGMDGDNGVHGIVEGMDGIMGGDGQGIVGSDGRIMGWKGGMVGVEGWMGQWGRMDG